MRLLVGIMTAHKYDYYIDDNTVDWCTQKRLRGLDQPARVNTIRETWLRGLPAEVDYKFFYGTNLRRTSGKYERIPSGLRAPLADEVYLPCGDNYTENPAKMKAICNYAASFNYDHLLRCDDDTFIYPDRLLATDWAQHDYSGAATHNFHPGGCMFLSRRTMPIICDAPITNYADDVWIGGVLKSAGIPMHTIPSMRNQWGTGYKVPIDIDPTGISSFHSCTPNVMRVLHAKR